ncbi:MAG: 4-(cytidine 5'-diphospho)-2-C-methyl-D-erythritol kinase [Betaproteobacteria bacterium]|nr:4-(cytidine 5'-diphospho)-2-C-methyl-D-erythritol kinase [Betaproteobacteria bacterium]
MARQLIDCAAPAKLNLFLHVVGRRADGYHLLQSVFQLIDLHDTLHFRLREDLAIVRSTEIDGVAAEQDLSVRAARLLQSKAQARGIDVAGVEIATEKRLPMGGGIGGGSSNAATTLIALNHLWGIGLSRTDLMRLGLALGADVPFFLGGGNAFVEGIGERLTPVQTAPSWFVLIHPGVSVPTPLIFQSPELTRDSKVVKIADFSDRLPGFGRNDLQAVAARAFPPVADALDWLSHRADARMTGSGAGVFASFASESDAAATLQQVPAQWRAWKAKALAEHPMAHLLPS